MEKLSDVANGRNELLSELAKNFAIKEGEFVADIIAPGISKPDFCLGAFEYASEPATPVADILGQDMLPNYMDTYNRVGLEKFQLEDHELRGRVSNNLRQALRCDGLSDDQIDKRIVNQLIRNLRANYEIQVLDAIGNSNNYASGLSATPSTKWDAEGTAKKDVCDAITALEKKGAPTATMYLVADPATWGALRNNTKVTGSDVNGLKPFYSNEDIAHLLAGPTAHAVVAKQMKGNAFAFAGKMAIVCRPEGVAADSDCSWRTVYGGQTSGPEPYVYRFSEPGTEHRGYTIGCALDRKLIGQGNNASGKMIWGYIFSGVLT